MPKAQAPTTETMSATEAVRRFGELSELASPVTVIKHGRPAFVLLSVQQYEKLLEAFMKVHNIED